METCNQHQENRENRGNRETVLRQEGQSPPSQSSSPSHEFSFTISLHSDNNSSATIPDKSKAAPPSSLAIDLSPADDIFFHGHLLPLHLLSHLPSSPRFSTNSMESLTLPIRDLLEDEKLSKESGSRGASNRSNITILDSISNNNYREEYHNKRGTKEESNKSKASFSLFGSTRGRKGCQVSHDNKEDKEKQKRKVGYDVIHALKRYLRMVQQPLVLLKGKREKIGLHHGHAYSHSGNLMRKNYKPELLRGRRGEHSAPASMRTSPTNSGLLLAKATAPLPPSAAAAAASDSTMEELQAAIQAAIAHCKNSIAKEEKLKC